jgi:hypothetical protein
MHKCSKCKEHKTSSEFYKNKSRKSGLNPYCKSCEKSRQRKLLYGVDQEQYNKMYSEQKGACKICLKNFPSLYVDHDHNSGKPRALLCHHCNTVLGLAFENTTILSNAITYLESFGDSRTPAENNIEPTRHSISTSQPHS